MKCFSLFSGVGGFELGFPKDWELVGFSEIDKYSSMVLKYHHPKVKNYDDCTKIKYDEIPDFDLLTGGSPCQDFSIAGNRAGIVGSRSGLVWEYIRCLREKQPRYFIWENVRGVMSSRGGWDFANILTAFSEGGYNLWWQVLNAKDFGVPQNRERVFVVGCLGKESPKEVFFEPRDCQEVDYQKPDVAYALDTGYSKGMARRARTMILQHSRYSDGSVKYNYRDVAGSLKEPSGNQQNFLEDDLQNVRRLMPIECERLMGWPDNHTKFGTNEKEETIEISDSQRYKMCGNGVVSNVVREIVNNLITQ